MKTLRSSLVKILVIKAEQVVLLVDSIPIY